MQVCDVIEKTNFSIINFMFLMIIGVMMSLANLKLR